MSETILSLNTSNGVTRLMKKPMTIEDIANLVPIEVLKKRGSYKKKVNG